MKLYEYESADIFSGFGIRVPERRLAVTADEVVSAAEKIGFPVVVKAQVLTGGRGLAGGVINAALVMSGGALLTSSQAALAGRISEEILPGALRAAATASTVSVASELAFAAVRTQ